MNFLRGAVGGGKKKKKKKRGGKKFSARARGKVPVYPAMRFARLSTKSPRTNDGKNKAKK